MPTHDHAIVGGLFKQAIAEGGYRRSLMRIDWAVAGNCENPITRTLFARPAKPADAREIIVIPGKTQTPIWVELDVRCRACRNCLKYRRSVWAARAIAEVGYSMRTWKCTWTFRPEAHDVVQNLLRRHYAQMNEDFDCLSADRQYMARHIRCSKEITLWFKRVRKNSGARLRFLLVAEAHKSGLPHYHALVHEQEVDASVTKSVMENAWTLGHAHFRLIDLDDKREATYACKYLSKDVRARVRASIHYGNGPSFPTV